MDLPLQSNSDRLVVGDEARHNKYNQQYFTCCLKYENILKDGYQKNCLMQKGIYGKWLVQENPPVSPEDN